MAVGDYISEIQTSDGSTYPIGSSVWVSSETWNGRTKTEVEHEIKTKFINLTEITWSSLKSLADAGTLVPGQYYRITDYTCTTTVSGTKSAGHVFDIIVRADSVNKLNEEAHAIQHTGDTYFANCDLNAWKIWYCLDNDTNRFTWADNTNGKGVIYRMIDEFNNDVPYDFKNIQFYRQWNSNKSSWSTISSDTTGVPCYTFSSNGDSSTVEFTDFSLSRTNNVYSNVIKECIFSGKLGLNINCFFGSNYYYNTFGNECCYNTFGNGCYNNTFGNKCYENTFGNKCYENTFGNNCFRNTFGNKCNFNIFGNSCCNNTFGEECDSNIFGNICSSNTFGYYCHNNIFGNDSIGNTFGEFCQNNTFGNDCYNNTFGDRCSYNTFGNYCRYNTFGEDCYYNTFGEFCQNNTFGDSCYSNTFGNNCRYNTFGSRIEQSQFGNGVQYFSITNAQMTTKPTSANAKSYIRWLIVENGVSYVNAYVTGYTSDSSYCQNIRICQGCSGTADDNRKSFDITACIGSTVNNIYQPANSQITNI